MLVSMGKLGHAAEPCLSMYLSKYILKLIVPTTAAFSGSSTDIPSTLCEKPDSQIPSILFSHFYPMSSDLRLSYSGKRTVTNHPFVNLYQGHPSTSFAAGTTVPAYPYSHNSSPPILAKCTLFRLI